MKLTFWWLLLVGFALQLQLCVQRLHVLLRDLLAHAQTCLLALALGR